MTKAEKELVELTEKWTSKIQEVTSGYEKAIGKLDRIRQDLESQKKSWHQVLLQYLPYLYPIMILLIICVVIHFLGCNTIKMAGIEITCPNK